MEYSIDYDRPFITSIDSPFRTYQEIQEAVKTGKAVLSYDRTAAYNIACDTNKKYIMSNLIIPLISILAMLIVCQIFSITKWVLLFGIFSLIAYTFVPHLRSLFWVIAIILIALPLLFLHNLMWLLAFGFGIIGMIVGYDIWMAIITSTARKALLNNESLFESVWIAKKVAIKDNNTTNGFYMYGSGDLKNNGDRISY